MPKWIPLGSGNFNNAYKSEDGKSVLKIPKSAENATEYPERAVRLWNQINSHVPPPASIEKNELGFGWVCPFIEGEQASDDEISSALIDIFNRSGRIIVDAPIDGNFRKTPPPNSQVVCVDIGMALQMEQRQDDFFHGKNPDYSIVSQEYWKEYNSSYDRVFIVHKVSSPETVNTIKALLFIKNNRPDIYDVQFLQRNRQLIVQLAEAYDAQKKHDVMKSFDPKIPPKMQEGLDLLKEQRPINTDNIKDSCINELKKYIDSRGTINQHGEFEPSLITRLFRNAQLTATKVNAAKELIKEISQAKQPEEIGSAIKKHLDTPELLKATFSSGLGSSLGTCMLIASIAKNEAPKSELTLS